MIKTVEIDRKKTTVNKGKTILKISAYVGGIVLVFIGALTIYLYPRVRATQASFQKTFSQADVVRAKAVDQDIIAVREQSLVLKDDIDETKKSLDKLSFLRSIPLAGNYYSDSVHLLNAGSYSTEAAVLASDALVPFADSLGLKGTSSTGKEKAEDKVSKLVQIMPKLLPQVDALEQKIHLIQTELAPINPDHYPRELGGVKIRSFLKDFRTFVSLAQSVTPELKPILTSLPQALGDPTPKTYIILLQNNAELRSTGGFITSVAYITLSKGSITSVRSEDTYRIDERLYDAPAAPDYIAKYLKQPTLNVRDSNISPDFVVSMDTFNKLYQNSHGKIPFDGFIALDTEFVRKILAVTGPVTTDKYKETFSSDISTDGIPDVIYKLELYSQKILRQSDDRKELLGDLLNSLLKAILTSPSQKWQPLIDATLQSTQEKHLLTYSFEKSTQALVEKYNMAGRIKDYDGDYLHINENNLGGLKSNLFVTQYIEQEITVDGSGSVTKTVKFNLNNPKKADGWLNGLYRDYVRIYVPQGSRLDESKTKDRFDTSVDLGKTVFSTLVSLDPQSSTTLTLTYTLPFKVSKGQPYKLLVQKQPGTKDEKVSVKINGKDTDKFTLTTDKEASYSF